MMPSAAIRAAIQQLLDAEGDGWHVSQFVIAMGLERVDSNGRLESSPWIWAPADQPSWQTTGLLDQAVELQSEAEETEDD